MPITISDITGDGKTTLQIINSIELPDSGTSVLIEGQIQSPINGLFQAITGSPLTMPVAPGSGTIWWNIQVSTATGAATVQQSAAADPPALAGNVVVFRSTLVPGQADPALVATSTTPDS